MTKYKILGRYIYIKWKLVRENYTRFGHSVPLRDKIIYFSASFETPFLADGVSSRFFLSLYPWRRNVKNLGGDKSIHKLSVSFQISTLPFTIGWFFIHLVPAAVVNENLV